MQQFFDFPVTPVSSLDNFIVCEGTAAAHAFAMRIADPADPDTLLYLYGPHGSGKTHLLKALAAHLLSSAPLEPYISCREPDRLRVIADRACMLPLLVVDDLDLLPDDASIRGALWQAFNEFYASGRPVVMAGLLPPRELPTLDDHLVSRLLWGLVARLDVSDDSSRRMIIKKIAEDKQILVPDELLDYILATSGREAGELISAFEQLYRCSMSTKRKMTLALARECLAAGGQR